MTNLLCDSPGSLVKETLKLLEKENDLSKVAARTNVPYHWLVKFKARAINKPNANRVQYLFEKLSGKAALSK